MSESMEKLSGNSIEQEAIKLYDEALETGDKTKAKERFAELLAEKLASEWAAKFGVDENEFLPVLKNATEQMTKVSRHDVSEFAGEYLHDILKTLHLDVNQVEAISFNDVSELALRHIDKIANNEEQEAIKQEVLNMSPEQILEELDSHGLIPESDSWYFESFKNLDKRAKNEEVQLDEADKLKMTEILARLPNLAWRSAQLGRALEESNPGRIKVESSPNFAEFEDMIENMFKQGQVDGLSEREQVKLGAMRAIYEISKDFYESSKLINRSKYTTYEKVDTRGDAHYVDSEGNRVFERTFDSVGDYHRTEPGVYVAWGRKGDKNYAVDLKGNNVYGTGEDGEEIYFSMPTSLDGDMVSSDGKVKITRATYQSPSDKDIKVN